MKTLLLLLGCPLLVVPILAEQDTFSDPALPDPSSIRFVPPPPPAEVPAITVRGSTVAEFPTHRISILRGEPSSLPDVPAPKSAEVTKVARVPIGGVERDFQLSISGFTYDKGISRVEVWNPFTKTRHIAWCGWDVSLLAPYHQIPFQGKLRTLHLMVAAVDTSKWRNGSAFLRGKTDPVPAPGEILVPDGDVFVTDLLTSLKDLHLRNRPKLEAIRAAAEQSRADAAAWHAANPPQPQDHTIWLKPHRGNRYLEAPTTTDKEGGQ